MESRIFRSPEAPGRWSYAPVPPDWRVDPRRNILGGTVAAVVSLPLCMGLGAIAFAPLGPQHVTAGVIAGLYAAAFLGLIAVLAGARGVAIYAPRSLVSFIAASVCAQVIVGATWIPENDPAAAASAFFLLLAMAGALQLVFGAARLARLVKFIPTPVMAGFQNAAAIIITLSLLHVFLGLSSRPAWDAWPEALPGIKPLSLLVGAFSVALVFGAHRITGRLSPLLVGLLGGTLFYYLLAAAGYSAALGGTLGAIPGGMPDGSQLAGIMAVTQLPGFLPALPGMVLAAASIAVVASLDVLISAKLVENVSGQRGNSTRELLCIGTANAITPLLGGVIGSISLAATMANHKGGARTSLALFVHGLLFLVLVPIIAPLLGYIPLVVIAALVMHAGLALFDRWTLQLVRRVLTRRMVNWDGIALDLAVIALVTGVALAGEIVIAVLLGVAIAIMVFTYRMSRGVIRSTRAGDEVHSRRTREGADIALLTAHGRQILAIELEGPMFFASAELLHNRIDAAIADNVRYVILDMARVNELDSTGARILLQTRQRMSGAGVHLLLCGHEEHMQTATLLRDHGVADALGRERLFPDLDRALEWCENHLLAALKSDRAALGDHPFELLDVARGLEPAERDTLRASLERRDYPAGAVVFAEGDSEDGLYIIVRGTASVRLQTPAPSGDRRLVTFSPGTVFGEMALLDRDRRSATVTADEPLTCYVLPRPRFENLAEEHPRIGLKLLANLGRELSMRMRRANRTLAERM